jgi:hypothetical protein
MPNPARPKGCSFEVLDGGATRPYLVIGVIDIDAFSVRAVPRNDDELRRVIADRVCKVGGDAVMPGVNGDGRYVLAKVVRYANGAPAPCCEPKPGPTGGGLVDGAPPARQPGSHAGGPSW